MTGKDKFLSLATSLELSKYYNFSPSSSQKYFISHLPIYIDATCNGLQHLAAMANDVNLGRYVNILKSTGSDIPNDLYSIMVDRIKEDISTLIKDNIGNAILSKLNITREFVKRGIMTIPYGVTPRGVREQLRSEHFVLLEDKDEKNRQLYKVNPKFIDPTLVNSVKFRLNDINNIGIIIHDVLYKTYPNLLNVVDYLKEMNSFLHKLGLDIAIIWKTPSGLILEQKYVKFDKKVINTAILGRNSSITLKKPRKKDVDLKRQNHGIIPNLIHSLDASNISLLVNKLIEDK